MSKQKKLKAFISGSIFLYTSCFAQNSLISVNGISYPSQASGNYENYCSHENTKLGVLNQSAFQNCLQRSIGAYQEIVYMIKTTPQKSYAYGFLQNILDAEVKSQTKRFGRDDIFVKMVLEMSIERAKEIDYLFQNKPNGKAVSQKCVKEGLNTYSDFLWLNSLHECMKKNL